MTAKKTQPEPGSEVVEAEFVRDVVHAEASVVPRVGDVVSQYLRNEAEDDGVPEGAGYQSIIEQIMSARDADSLFTETMADKPDDIFLRKLIVNGFSLNDSDFDQGAPVYASIKVYDTIDEVDRVVNTGNQAVIAQLLRAQQLELLPAQLMFKQGQKPNKFGKFPIRLVAWKD